MAHAPARRGGHACDVTDNGLSDILSYISGCFFLFDAADLAYQHDRLCVRIRLESLETVDKGRARDRVTTDADASRHTDPHLFQLVESLIGEGTAAAHYAYRASGESDLASGDADIAFPGAYPARAVRPN